MATRGSSSARIVDGKRMSTASDAYKPLPDAEAQDQQNCNQPCYNPTCVARQAETDKLTLMQNQLDQVQKVLVQMQLNLPHLSSAHFHNIPVFTAELDRYGNGGRYQDWCEEYVAKCNAMGIVGDHLATDVVLHLSGKAYRVYNSIPKATLESWVETDLALRLILDPDGSKEAKHDYDSLCVEAGESVTEFAARLKKRYRQAQPHFPMEHADAYLLYKLISVVPEDWKRPLGIIMAVIPKKDQIFSNVVNRLEKSLGEQW